MIERLVVFFLIIIAGTIGWQWFGNLSNDVEIPTTSDEQVLNLEKEEERPAKELASAVKAIELNSPNFNDAETTGDIKAVYVTAQTASNSGSINKIINLIDSTELNSLVINIKDGDQIFLTQWMSNLVSRLREKNIYPIARIVLFQDNYTAKTRSDLALKNPDGSLWGKPGYYWVDPASREVWDYNIEVAIKTLDIGFREVNFDYVRFPDGNIDDIVYPFYKYDRLKKDVINEAADYINKKIKEAHPDAVISLDIFAYSFLRTYDIGVGQKLIELAKYYDVIAPMIYPSHYDAGNFGFENPADHPYEVVLETLLSGRNQLENAGVQKMVRPWIQDFNMGAVYDQKKIQAQINAVKNALGQESWMSWNPNNIYSIDKYKNSDIISPSEP